MYLLQTPLFLYLRILPSRFRVFFCKKKKKKRKEKERKKERKKKKLPSDSAFIFRKKQLDGSDQEITETQQIEDSFEHQVHLGRQLKADFFELIFFVFRMMIFSLFGVGFGPYDLSTLFVDVQTRIANTYQPDTISFECLLSFFFSFSFPFLF